MNRMPNERTLTILRLNRYQSIDWKLQIKHTFIRTSQMFSGELFHLKKITKHSNVCQFWQNKRNFRSHRNALLEKSIQEAHLQCGEPACSAWFRWRTWTLALSKSPGLSNCSGVKNSSFFHFVLMENTWSSCKNVHNICLSYWEMRIFLFFRFWKRETQLLVQLWYYPVLNYCLWDLLGVQCWLSILFPVNSWVPKHKNWGKKTLLKKKKM